MGSMRGEDQIQIAVMNHIRFRGAPGVLAIHINNTPRGPRHGRKLKAMGLAKGAPDLLYVGLDRIVWHELKTEKGRLSPDQKAFHDKLRARGQKVIVTYGLNDALKQMAENGIITGG